MSVNAIADEPEDDDAFQLPMLGLYADLDVGCGSVLLPDEFHQAEPEAQRRILADWQRGLAALQQRLGTGVPDEPVAGSGSGNEPGGH